MAEKIFRYADGRAKNFASDVNVRQRIKNEIVPLLQHIRDRRKPLNRMWQSLMRVWTLEHEEQMYTGRSNIYVPAGKKSAETITSQLVSGTFPGDDNFGVEARNPDYNKDALGVKQVLQHIIENQARVRMHADLYYRQLVLRGNSPVKVYHRKTVIPAMRRSRKSLTRAPEEGEQVVYDAPVFEPIDMLNLYYWPENASDPREAEVVFEDLTISVSKLRHGARRGIYDKEMVEKIGQNYRLSEKEHNDNASGSAQGLTSMHDVVTEGWGYADISEVYVWFDPYARSRFEEDHAVPFLITICNGEVLRAIRNPFWHQMPPYLLGRMGTLPNRLYGTGYMETIQQLNFLLNDQVNQSMDAATFAINPIVLTNPNQILGTLPDIEPGVQWMVNDIDNAVKMITPPMEVLQAGSMLATQTMSWLQDFMGAPPVLQGGSSPGRAFRTATGVGTAQRNAVVPLQEVIRLSESEVWERMLFMFHSLSEQFAEEDYLIHMAGSVEGFRVPRKQLAGEWMFRWLASTQTDNKMLKGTQITQLLTVLSAPPVQQALMANQVQFNPVPLVRRLYQEVYGFRDVDELIKPMMAPPGMPPQVGAPPPGVEGQQDQPGMEGNDEFNEMRAGSDDMSALFGGMGLTA